MYNSNEGPTKNERKTIELMESILKQCKNHLNLDKIKEQHNIEHMVNNMDIFTEKKINVKLFQEYLQYYILD